MKNSLPFRIIAPLLAFLLSFGGTTGLTLWAAEGKATRKAERKAAPADGYTVQPGVTIPQEAIDVTINATGEVLVKLAGQTDLTNLGQVELAVFANDAGLESIGQNLLLETPASGAANVGTPGADGFGTIRQGFLETSNVNPVSEITALITAQRAYEMNSKVITASDEVMRSVATLR